MTPSERIRASATVILHRGEGDAAEVYLVERSRAVRFFPGYHAFPGGTLDKAEQEAVAREGLDAFRRAAARELEEEVGVRVPPASLEPCGRILTPPFVPVRYDTQFFLARAAAGVEPRIVDTGELVSGRWWRPAEALRAWERQEVMLPPPTIAFLNGLAGATSFEEGARRIAAGDGLPHHRRFHIELHPDVHALPLRAPTLPPATTTVTFLVVGARELVVVDPGTPFEDERDVLVEVVEGLLRAGRRPTAIVLTHHHSDHWGSAEALKARFGFPVLAHAETASRLPGGLVDRRVAEGDSIPLGVYAPTGAAWRLDVLDAPGHAPGHVALRDSRFGALLVGDCVSGLSTILVDPDEGDMGAYLRTLEKLAALDPPIVLPAHGPALPGKAALVETLSHRRARQGRVEAALAKGPRTVEDAWPEAYADTPGAHPALAASQVESILRMLEREGKARRDGDRWALVGR